MKKVKKILSIILAIVSVIYLIWFSASYIEVIMKNTSGNPQYCFWNIFDLLVKYKL